MTVDEVIAYLLELTEVEPDAGAWTVHLPGGAKLLDLRAVPAHRDVRLVI